MAFCELYLINLYRTVFILACVLLLLKQTEPMVSPALAAVRDSYESLLMKYLLQTRNTNIDSDMSAIQTCTAVLPRLEKIFRLFKEAVSW